MKIYILADCYDHEILMRKFDTYEDAYNAMVESVNDTINDNCILDEDYGISNYRAWTNDGGFSTDWQINEFEV